MLNLIKTAQFRVLSYLLDMPGQKIKVRDVSKKTHVSPASVSVISKKMKKDGIIKGNAVDISNPITRALKILLNIIRIVSCIGIIKKRMKLDGIGIYGSWIKGTNSERSDIDLWFKVRKFPEPTDAAKLRAELRRKLGAEPSMLFLTKEKMVEIKKNNPSLYFSILHSFKLCGEDVDYS